MQFGEKQEALSAVQSKEKPEALLVAKSKENQEANCWNTKTQLQGEYTNICNHYQSFHMMNNTSISFDQKMDKQPERPFQGGREHK